MSVLDEIYRKEIFSQPAIHLCPDESTGGSYKLFCCAKTILSVMSVKSFVRHHSYMVSSFIFINNFHISQLGKNIARGETLLLVNSCFFLSFSVFMDHISCGLVTKK
jgi:hypothetical protein